MTVRAHEKVCALNAQWIRSQKKTGRARPKTTYRFGEAVGSSAPAAPPPIDEVARRGAMSTPRVAVDAAAAAAAADEANELDMKPKSPMVASDGVDDELRLYVAAEVDGRAGSEPPPAVEAYGAECGCCSCWCGWCALPTAAPPYAK